jgi:hypothetical protein
LSERSFPLHNTGWDNYQLRNAQIPWSGGGAELELRQQKASFINAPFKKAKNVKYTHELKNEETILFHDINKSTIKIYE